MKQDLEQEYHDLFDKKDELIVSIDELFLDWELPEPDRTEAQQQIIDQTENFFIDIENNAIPLTLETLTKLKIWVKKLKEVYEVLQQDQHEKTLERDRDRKYRHFIE